MVQNEEHMRKMRSFNLEPLPPLPHVMNGPGLPPPLLHTVSNQKLNGGKVLGMRLGYANSDVISCDNILQCDLTMHTVRSTVCMYTVHRPFLFVGSTLAHQSGSLH